MDIKKLRNKIVPILNVYHVRRAGIFGSATNNKMTASSDIDILIEIKKDISLFEFIEIKQKLEKVLGRKVDLVEYGAIKKALKRKIMQNQVKLI